MRLTYQQARYRENKPICTWCYVPCDPGSRTYRATGLCEFCYDDQPIILEHKEILSCLPR
jgi:hypothetical protein